MTLKSLVSNLRSLFSGLGYPALILAMAMLAGIAFAIRVYHLGVSDLTFDEAATAFISGKPYPEMLKYLLGAFHELPPGYYVLMRAWEFFAGRSEFALRYPSVMFGVLGVALIYRVGRRGLGVGAGIIAALLVALQPFHVYYSQDARMYTLMPLEALLMVYFFDRLCRDPRFRWWLALGATSALAVLTHYFMAFVVAALCVYLLLHLRAHRRVWLPWFGGLAAAGVVMVVWLLTSRAWRLVRRLVLSISWRAFVERSVPAQWMLANVVFGSAWHPSQGWLALIVALVVIGLLAAVSSRRWRTLRPGGAWLLPAWLIVPVLLLILVPERLETRYNAAIVPAYCLLLALAVTWLWQWSKYTRPLAPVALGLLIYVQAATLVPTMNVVKSDYGHVISYLNRHIRPGDSLVLNGPWQRIQMLYYPAPNVPMYWLPAAAPPGLDPAEARLELEKAIATSKRIWLLPAAVEDADPDRFVAGWLNEHAYVTSDYKELTLYTVGGSSGAPAFLNPPVTWDGSVQLASFRWVQSQAAPGEPLLLDLTWQVLRAPQRDLGVWVGLADRDGGVWYSTEVVPGLYFAPSQAWQAGQVYTTRIGLPVPFGAPPGSFDVRVNVMPLRLDSDKDYVTLPGAEVLSCASPQATPCPPMQAGEDFVPLHATFGQGPTLFGYQLGGAEFFQGRSASITLYWRPDHPLTDDWVERIELVDRAGNVAGQVEGAPVAAWFPPSQWTPGQLVADPQVMAVLPRAAPGDYSFRIGLFTLDGRALPVSVDGASKNWLVVGRVRITARERQFHAGPISHPLSVTFGDQIRLLGYDLTPGQETRLVLYWQALREMDQNYTVFTHVFDADGKPAGQKDSWPREGDYPTSFWMRGEVVKDEYLIPLSADAGPGAYRIELGLYERATMQRLPAVSNGARLKDDAVVVPMNMER